MKHFRNIYRDGVAAFGLRSAAFGVQVLEAFYWGGGG